MTVSKFTQENMCTFERTNCWNRIASVPQATIGAIRQSVAFCSDHGRRINHYTHTSKNIICASSPRSHGQDSSTQRGDRKPSRMFALKPVIIAKNFWKFQSDTIAIWLGGVEQHKHIRIVFLKTAHHCVCSRMHRIVFRLLSCSHFVSVSVWGRIEWILNGSLLCGKVHHDRVTPVLVCHSFHKYSRHIVHLQHLFQNCSCLQRLVVRQQLFQSRMTTSGLVDDSRSYNIATPSEPRLGGTHTRGGQFLVCTDLSVCDVARKWQSCGYLHRGAQRRSHDETGVSRGRPRQCRKTNVTPINS